MIEGQDGTGKTTQVEKLANWFRDNQDYAAEHDLDAEKVAVFNEPSGLPATNELDKIIKNKDNDLEPESNLLLFTAARKELWHKIAAPILESSGVVIASRNYWSTLSYQGYGQGVDRDLIIDETKRFLPERYFHPDVSFIMTLIEQEREKRLNERAETDSKKDTFESKGTDFQDRVTGAYHEIAQEFKIKEIDASDSIDEVFAKILTETKSKLGE